MARYLLLAMNGPTTGEGDDEAYHLWYKNDHIPQFLELEEVVTARRFQTLRGHIPGMKEVWPFVTAYEIETDDLPGFSKKLAVAMQSFAPTLDRSTSGHLMTIQLND